MDNFVSGTSVEVCLSMMDMFYTMFLYMFIIYISLDPFFSDIERIFFKI